MVAGNGQDDVDLLHADLGFALGYDPGIKKDDPRPFPGGLGLGRVGRGRGPRRALFLRAYRGRLYRMRQVATASDRSADGHGGNRPDTVGPTAAAAYGTGIQRPSSSLQLGRG